MLILSDDGKREEQASLKIIALYGPKSSENQEHLLTMLLRTN